MRERLILFLLAIFAVASTLAAEPASPNLKPTQEEAVLAASQGVFNQLVAGTVVDLTTEDWTGIDLFGRPMLRSDFQDPPSETAPRVWRDRDHFYNSIDILDQDVRLYSAEVAAVQTHANFSVTSDGKKLTVELQVLDIFVLEDEAWLLDFTQATHVGGPELPSPSDERWGYIVPGRLTPRCSGRHSGVLTATAGVVGLTASLRPTSAAGGAAELRVR